MTGKVKGFIYRMKSVAPHIFHIHCIIHIQQLVAKNIGGDMKEALNTSMHATNFDKSSSVSDFLCNSVKMNILRPHCFEHK